MKKIIKSLLALEGIVKRGCERVAVWVVCVRRLRSQMRINGIENRPVDGEREYIQFWKKLQPCVEPYSYRLFSRYMPDRAKWKYIIPEDIAHCFVDYYLNPPQFRDYYSDKNSYAMYLGDTPYLPETFLCRMQGGEILSSDFRPQGAMNAQQTAAFCSGCDRLILKPSVGTSSGVGVMLFRRSGDVFTDGSGQRLDSDFLMRYSDDFVLQRAVRQHEDLARFNPDSVNTIRLVAYRSVKDEKVYALSALLRIGSSGAFVDNAHAGGKFVGIDPASGCLNNYLCDQNGVRTGQHNGIDFSVECFKVPHWDKVLAAAQEICSRALHCRYFSLDLTVDEHDFPRMIELNVTWPGFWLSMFSGQLPLGDKTEEIVEYCRSRMCRG